MIIYSRWRHALSNDPKVSKAPFLPWTLYVKRFLSKKHEQRKQKYEINTSNNYPKKPTNKIQHTIKITILSLRKHTEEKLRRPWKFGLDIFKHLVHSNRRWSSSILWALFKYIKRSIDMLPKQKNKRRSKRSYFQVQIIKQ